MKQFELLSKNQKIIFIGILSFIICIIIYYFYTQYQSMGVSLEEINQTEVEEINIVENKENKDEEELIIHISGAVANEGVVTVIQGARISDVIDVAGGLKDNASLKNVNLAYMVEDGQKIYIPTKEEEQEMENEYTIVQEGNNSNKISYKEENDKVNINKATQIELEELPGIGSSTALKIIEYRKENGDFKSIDDIKNVNGIGDAKFNNIKEYIEV